MRMSMSLFLPVLAALTLMSALTVAAPLSSHQTTACQRQGQSDFLVNMEAGFSSVR